MLAQLVQCDQYQQNACNEALDAGPDIPDTAELDDLVDSDVRQLTWKLRRAKKGRSAPPWGIHSEAMLMILSPYRHSKNRTGEKTKGLGCKEDLDITTATAGMNRFKEIARQIRRRATTPQHWHHSMAWLIPKPNGAAGIKGQRMIHVFDPVGSRWLAAQYDRVQPSPTYWEHGGWRGRSREEAIITQTMATWRLRQAKRSFGASFYDATNAFACTRTEDLVQACFRDMPRRDAVHYEDRHRRKHFTITLGRDQYTFKPGEGDFMGFPTAPREFNQNYREPIRRWNMSLLANDSSYLDLVAESPIAGSEQKIDIGLTTFVDDVAKIHSLKKGERPTALAGKLNYSSDKLKNTLKQFNYEINTDKTMHVMSLFGTGAYNATRDLVQKKSEDRRPGRQSREVLGTIARRQRRVYHRDPSTMQGCPPGLGHRLGQGMVLTAAKATQTEPLCCIRPGHGVHGPHVLPAGTASLQATRQGHRQALAASRGRET
jgi:hypothetical protein